MSGTSSVSGVVVGTGADLNIDKVGFRPTAVKVINSDGDCFAEWIDTMPDDSAMKTIAAGTTAQITSNGITPRAAGFALGADTDLNVDGETVHYTCFK